MKISAFTFLRNGLTYGYPFIESIKSLLPIVDEYIVVLGDSNDGSEKALLELKSSKIKIIHTIWSDKMRTGGKIFALQANIGIDNASKDSDWLFHLQADEVIHENDYPIILKNLHDHLHNKSVNGFLLKFINFFGDYDHYCPSRRFHQREIRIIRNDSAIRSYKDSMGFRIFKNKNDPSEKGVKLKVIPIDASVYHYSWVRPPKKQKAKQIEFAKKYIESDDYINAYDKELGEEYNYREYDYLNKFTGSHPLVMKNVVNAQNWEFVYNPSKNNMTFKEKILRFIEKITNKQFFIYKNYKLIKNKDW